MKICIYGAGAIGGYLGVQLARAGADVSLVARGAHLAAMRQRGAISITLAARPLPVTLPIRALTSWIAIMNGVVRNTVHNRS